MDVQTIKTGNTFKRGYKIIESSFESSFELLDFILDEMTQS